MIGIENVKAYNIARAIYSDWNQIRAGQSVWGIRSQEALKNEKPYGRNEK